MLNVKSGLNIMQLEGMFFQDMMLLCIIYFG
jgi:hypothetical protein